MNGTGGGVDWANIIQAGNSAALTWYATATGKPIAAGSPPTAMRNIFGTDFSGGPTIQGQTFGAIGPVLVLGIVVVGVVLLVRR